MTVPFDLARAEVTGDATVAIGGVMQSGLRQRLGAENSAAGMFAVSSRGALAFVPGSLVGSAGSLMIWATPDGRTSSAEPAAGAPSGGRVFLRISPDGSRAIVQVPGPARREMWLADWTRDTWTLCGECSGDSIGVWSPEGGRLLLGRNDALFAHALDGSTPDRVVIREDGRRLAPANWLADGRIVYESSPDSTNYEIKLMEPGSGRGRVIAPLGVGAAPVVSPDGRWLAYTSLQTGAREVVVQAFPGPGAREQNLGGGRIQPRVVGGRPHPLLSAPDGAGRFRDRRDRHRCIAGARGRTAARAVSAPRIGAVRRRPVLRHFTGRPAIPAP